MASRVVQSIFSWLVVYKRTLKSKGIVVPRALVTAMITWKLNGNVFIFLVSLQISTISLYLFVTCNHVRRDKLLFIYRHGFVIFN